jgi:antagonist of KipI
MADHQTTGGYPRIGNVVSIDLPFLAQKGINETIRFEVISLEEAENLAVKFERDLNFLKTAINLYAYN